MKFVNLSRPLNSIATNTFIQAIGKFITAASTLLLTMLLTRYLGVEDFGALSTIVAYVALLATLVDFGITQIAVREASLGQNDQRKFMSNVVFLKLGQAILVVLIGILALPFTDYSHLIQLGILIHLFSLIFLSLMAAVSVIFQAKLQFKYLVAANVVQALAQLGLGALMIYTQQSLLMIVVSLTLAVALGACMAFFYSRRFFKLSLEIDKSLCRRLAISAAPLGVAVVLSGLFSKIDMVLLSIINGTSAVGIYSPAYKILETAIAFPGFFVAASFPLLSRLAASDRASFARLYQRSLMLLAGGGVVCIIAMLFLAKWLILILAGGEFLAAVWPLKALAFAAGLAFLSGLGVYALIALNQQSQLILINLAALIVNVLLNLVFLPLFSYKAAAVITVITEGFLASSLLIAVKKALT